MCRLFSQKPVTCRVYYSQEKTTIHTVRLAQCMPLESALLEGIVVLGGGGTYFVSAWVDILMIRSLNCTLPIELWVDDTPEERLPASVKHEMETKLGVEIRILDMLPSDLVQ